MIAMETVINFFNIIITRSVVGRGTDLESTPLGFAAVFRVRVFEKKFHNYKTNVCDNGTGPPVNLIDLRRKIHVFENTVKTVYARPLTFRRPASS